MKKVMRQFAFCLAVAVTAFAGEPRAAVTLSDAVVFSANDQGNNWLGLIWNTQGQPADGPNRWNLYLSSSSDTSNPDFVNGFNDDRTQIAIPLAPGEYTFQLFAESIGATLPSEVHFVLNLYFDGNQTSPDISGLYGPTCLVVCAAGHPNGLDIFGASGEAEAGTLEYASAGLSIALTAFEWNTASTGIDVVWPNWHDAAPYDTGSGTPDYLGLFTLRVTQVPEPGTFALFAIGLAGLAAMRRRIMI